MWVIYSYKNKKKIIYTIESNIMIRENIFDADKYLKYCGYSNKIVAAFNSIVLNFELKKLVNITFEIRRKQILYRISQH